MGNLSPTSGNLPRGIQARGLPLISWSRSTTRFRTQFSHCALSRSGRGPSLSIVTLAVLLALYRRHLHSPAFLTLERSDAEALDLSSSASPRADVVNACNESGAAMAGQCLRSAITGNWLRTRNATPCDESRRIRPAMARYRSPADAPPRRSSAVPGRGRSSRSPGRWCRCRFHCLRAQASGRET